MSTWHLINLCSDAIRSTPKGTSGRPAPKELMRSNNATAVASPKPWSSGRVGFESFPESLHSLRIRWRGFWLLAQKWQKAWKVLEHTVHVLPTNQHVHVKLICTNVAVTQWCPQAYRPGTFQKQQLPWLPCLTNKHKSWMDLRCLLKNPPCFTRYTRE